MTGQDLKQLFAVKTESLSAVFVVLVGLVAYAGPIVAGTIYLQNIYNGLEQVRTDITRLQSGPEAIQEIRGQLRQLEDLQKNVLVGDTTPQVLLRERISGLSNAISGCRDRAEDFEKRIRELRHDVDILMTAQKGRS